ncbi:MAG: HAD hydrolase family protein [Clostridium sp.]|nr:HAD hydrolase family protein [Clostridium sp.]MEE0092441.1 HAD hydrolase family protein [Bacilli bacterium]
MPKLLVSDYDQTFYLNDNDIENNKIYVNKFMDSGNLFVIATGRSYLDFHNKLDIYDFNYNYAILNHGTTIIDKNNKVLFNICIPDVIIPQIQNDLNLSECIDCFCCGEIDSRVTFEHKHLTKIHIKYNSKEYALDKANFINNKYGNYVKAYYVNTNSIEIISNKTNKAKAIYWLIKFCNNVNKTNTYVIGDGYSDIEMVQEFNGYCMTDSVSKLKSIAIREYDSVSSLIKEILNSEK